MRKLGLLAVMFVGLWPALLAAQGLVTPTGVTRPKANVAKSPAEKPTSKIPGIDKALKLKEPVTTEIYADEAFFDATKYIGIFTGHVKVSDPRFTLQADKLTIHVKKGKDQGLEKAVAEGNVGMVRDQPDPNGGPSVRSVGRAETVTYSVETGEVELKGTPRVQQGLNMQVATSPDTVMIINQDGQLSTHGPSRTDIRQEPKPEESEKKAEASPGQ
jgi:lipopolysaccharide transport protein LptA